jgi:CheY-like chemotaxis protein
MLIEETVHMLSRTFGKEIGIQMALDPDLVPVEADATRIQQAILNICLNARDAMPRGGLLFIETANAALDESEAGRFGVSPGAYARTRIRDTGCGMDAKTLSRIFEPFFTTKGKADGNGLGLAIAMEIVRQHGGGIGVTSRPGEGSSFELVLPVTAGRKASQEIIREAKVLPRGHETLLLVDDEEVIRRMGKRMLERFGYRVLMAKDGEDALRLVRRSDTDIDLLILDKVMPAMDGTETLKQIQKIKPGIRALLTSGFWSGDATETSRKQGFCGFIPKPFLVGQVLNLIRQSLDGPIPLMPQ